ncbi:MAG: NADP-dependent oxidoreductase [Candidatus Omnitrophica bacterium]|nr:NADP-dependent oxidoreductase [Candidatus Omnitrophota bacterium]
MRAIQLQRFGDPQVLCVEELPVPSPNPEQVLIKVHAAGLNPIDWKTRRGLGFAARHIEKALPWTPGYDLAGEIVACGAAVTEFRAGQAVFGMAGFPFGGGAHAEFALAEAPELCLKPPDLSFSEAAGAPLAALTAYQALFDEGQCGQGQRVLILAAAGGVGHLAVQLARDAKACVIATASEKNRGFVLSLGAFEFVDYTSGPLAKSVGGVDLVLDAVGGQTGVEALACLKPGGRLVTLPTASAAEILNSVQDRDLSVRGMTVRPNSSQLKRLAGFLARKELRVSVQGEYDFQKVCAAHEELEKGHVRGKLVLKM